ncbi:hypothetical protein AVEN_89604-1 [Araneus ventricosus]|uniref:Uncharacterized protein n=1 Tax=Araneus ventricosus TaxID=182803 RepID=A0A4Y2JUY1_ARAVE|nr:hypothetical protein AVEN_89604-1 [Araneus ventricosus]
MQQDMEDDDDLAGTMIFSDEERILHLSGKVNRQNVRVWGTEGPSLHTFNTSIFEHMITASAEKKEIQGTMPRNVGLPSPGISKLLQCHLNYSG